MFHCVIWQTMDLSPQHNPPLNGFKEKLNAICSSLLERVIYDAVGAAAAAGENGLSVCHAVAHLRA